MSKNKVGLGTRINLFRNNSKWVELVVVDITSTTFTTMLFHDESNYEIISMNRRKDWINLIFNKQLNVIEYKDCSADTFMFKPKKKQEIEIKYQKKWYNAEIINVTDNIITIKLWKSIFKVKTMEIERANHWKYLILQKQILFKTIYPNWIRIGQSVWWLINGIFYPSQILKFKDGKSITIYYITYNGYKKPNGLSIKTLKTKKLIQTESSINTSDGIVIYENYHIFDDLQNKTLLQQLSCTQHGINNNKSTHKQVIPISNNDKINDMEYSTTSNKQRYCNVLQCELFPITILQIIVAFLIENILYICPPFESIEKTIKWKQYPYINQSFVNSKAAKIGLEFEMNVNLCIKGIKLSECRMYGTFKHEIHLVRYVQTAGRWNKLDINTALIDANNEFLFEHPLEVQVENIMNNKYLYRLVIETDESTQIDHWHEIHKNNQIIPTQINWKCFASINWVLFTDHWRKMIILKKRLKRTMSASIFPHIAFIL